MSVLHPNRAARCLLPLLFAAAACGSSGGSEKDACLDGCAANQVCIGDACTCAEGFLDCDGDLANGCERVGSNCGPCEEEAVAVFCAAHGAECGRLTAVGRCGKRTAECGACGDGEECGSETANRCGEPSCEGESDAQLCRNAGKDCGSFTVTDRCGVRRTVPCGTCASDEVCRANECEIRILGDREPCIRNGKWLGICDQGYRCAGDDTAAVCWSVCESDADCRNGMRCAPEIWEDGAGTCGNLRSEGQSCHWIEDGVDFCYDPAADEEGTGLYCFNGRCRYVCAARESGVELPCPGGHVCESEWKYFSDVGLDVHLCKTAPEVGEREACFAGDVEVAPCAEGLTCVIFNDGTGLCFRACTDDDGCPDGQRCAAGFLVGGGGICGDLKGPGETGCQPPDGGPAFCWDFGAVPDSALTCLGDTCRYACGVSLDSSLSFPCPDDHACKGGYVSYPEYQWIDFELCVDSRLDEKETCFADGEAVGECKPGLECVGTDLRKVCQTVCFDDTGCAEGRVCLAGALSDGRGSCVVERAEGETCVALIEDGQEVCDVDGLPEGSSLQCLNGRCRYVCHREGSPDPQGACPDGMLCSALYRTYPSEAERLAICELPCVPESDSQLCANRGYGCGTPTITDRCGTSRTVSCGSCSSGSACSANRCLSSNIPENAECLDRAGTPIACAAGLVCVDWGLRQGTCKRQCYYDSDCPGAQRCAIGALEGGSGICGNFRAGGWSCDSMSTGSNFCWTDETWDRVECLEGICEYVCAVESTWNSWSCPAGKSCSSSYVSYPGWSARLATCQ